MTFLIPLCAPLPPLAHSAPGTLLLLALPLTHQARSCPRTFAQPVPFTLNPPQVSAQIAPTWRPSLTTLALCDGLLPAALLPDLCGMFLQQERTVRPPPAMSQALSAQ